MKCPKCGNKRISTTFDVPEEKAICNKCRHVGVKREFTEV
jgi:ribosomal protein S27E